MKESDFVKLPGDVESGIASEDMITREELDAMRKRWN